MQAPPNKPRQLLWPNAGESRRGIDCHPTRVPQCISVPPGYATERPIRATIQPAVAEGPLLMSEGVVEKIRKTAAPGCVRSCTLRTADDRERSEAKIVEPAIAGESRWRIVTMKAIWRGQVIAESERTLEVDGHRYFPRETVRMDLLQVSPKTQSDLECPHGVQFYDVAGGAAVSERAAWSYEAPRASMKQIDHWIGFWEDVEIE